MPSLKHMLMFCGYIKSECKKDHLNLNERQMLEIQELLKQTLNSIKVIKKPAVKIDFGEENVKTDFTGIYKGRDDDEV